MAVLDALRLNGRVALVTGSGGRLGRAMALALAEAGADLVLAGEEAPALHETAALAQKSGRQVLVEPLDVTDSAAVNAVVGRSLETFGRIDVLINNPGGTSQAGKPLLEVSDIEWCGSIEANLSAQFYCARAVVPQMLEQEHGKIINIASGLGLRGSRDNFAYAAAKAAVVNFTRSLAVSYADRNIQINGIAPGILADTPEEEGRWRGGMYVPVGRAGRPWEVGPLTIYLASDASQGMNGETIAIDGGGTAGGVTPTGWDPRIPLPGGTI